MSPRKDRVIVTRHPSLIQYFRKIGLADEDTPVVPFATVDDVRDKHVIGVLPLHIAKHAASLTTVPLNLPTELRGKELNLEQVARYAGAPVTVRVLHAESPHDEEGGE